MRRNNLMNDKVIKALTIGLTAMIAVTSTPMTAFADEVEENPGEGSVEAAPESGSSESSSSEAQDSSAPTTESAVSAATEIVNTFVEGNEGVAAPVDISNATDAVVDVTENVGAINIIEKEEYTEDKVKKENTKASTLNVDLSYAEKAQENVTNAEEALKATADNLKTAASAEEVSSTKAAEAQTHVYAADDAVDSAKGISEEVVGIEKDYQAQADKIASKIEDAGSVEDARELLEAAKQIGKDAKASYNEKLEEYNKAIEAYDAEREAYVQAIEDLKAAEKAYREAIGNTSGTKGAAQNIKVAIENLTAARDNETALKEAAQVAYDKMQKDAGILIMEAEEEAVTKRNKGNDNANWASLDILFDVIVRNYYIPEFLKDEAGNPYGRDIIIEAKSVKADNSGIEKEVPSIGDLNYKLYIVKDKEGKELAKYRLDYKMDESGKFRVDGEGKIIKGLNVFVKDADKADYVQYTENGIKYVVPEEGFVKLPTFKEIKYGNGYGNQDYLRGEAQALKEVGTELRGFVDASIQTRDTLKELSSDDGTVAKTIANLDTALDAATKLKDTINKLQINNLISGIDGIGDIGTLINKLEAKIKEIDDKKEEADEEIEEAKEILDEIIETIEDIEDVVDDLTPPADETPTGETPAPTGGTPYVAPILPIATPTFPAGPIALPDAGVAGVRRIVDGNIAEIEDMFANAAKLKKIADDKDILDLKEISKLTRIEDEEVALAAVPDDVKKNMNWWWLVVVALLGATGYELYRKHEEKKQEAEANKVN